jgi:hypothetical protein
MDDRGQDSDEALPHAAPPAGAIQPTAPVLSDPAAATSPAVDPVAPVRSRGRDAWRTSLREFFVIVAGVLAALGAQAIWEGRQERELEQSYLAQLARDAHENADRLASAILQDSAADIAAGKLIRALDLDLPGVAPDSIMQWLDRAGSSSEFQPVTGTHRAILETGDLRVVRDERVRAALVSYATSLDRETARIEQLRGATLDLVPELARALPFMRLIFSGGPDVRRLDVAALQRNDEAAVVIFALQAANRNRMGGLRRMRAETLELLDVLDDAGARADTVPPQIAPTP